MGNGDLGMGEEMQTGRGSQRGGAQGEGKPGARWGTQVQWVSPAGSRAVPLPPPGFLRGLRWI